MCVVYIFVGKWFLLIHNCKSSPTVAPHLEYSQGMSHFNHHQRLFGIGDLPCHRKWASDFPPKINMVSLKIQHHQPCVIPPKVLGKLTTLHPLLNLPVWKIILSLSPNFSNVHIALWHRTMHIQNLHRKTCKHYLCRYFPDRLFGFCINTKFLNLWDFGWFVYFSPIGLFLSEKPWNTSHKTPLPKKKCLCHGVNFVMSTPQHIIVLGDT